MRRVFIGHHQHNMQQYCSLQQQLIIAAAAATAAATAALQGEGYCHFEHGRRLKPRGACRNVLVMDSHAMPLRCGQETSGCRLPKPLITPLTYLTQHAAEWRYTMLKQAVQTQTKNTTSLFLQKPKIQDLHFR